MTDLRIPLFDITLANLSMEAVLNLFGQTVRMRGKKMVFFLNAHNFTVAHVQARYRRILRESDVVLRDGIGIGWALRLVGNRLTENVNGTDLFPKLCAYAEKNQFSIYFVGGKIGVAEKLCDTLWRQYPHLKIVGVHHGFFTKEEESALIDDIHKKEPAILLVGLGTPKQEDWIHSNISRLRCNIALGVGGLFDFYSGQKKRAPKAIRTLGLEWAYRLLLEPRRLWKRYLIGIPFFIAIVVRKKVGL